MTHLEILDQMIKDTAKIPTANEHGKLSVTLNEPQSPDSSVTIHGIPSDTLVIRVDTFRSPDTIFSGSKGECKRADYVIVSDNGKKKHILYIEMKKTKDSWNAVVKQLMGAKCFISYCQEIGRSFWHERDFLKNYQHRFISFGRTNINKRKTRTERPSGKHDTPQRALKIYYPHRTQFNFLAGT